MKPWRAAFALVACAASLMARADEPYDLIITGGTVYDGTGTPGLIADVGVRGDRIARIGNLSGEQAKRRLDAKGLGVAPGFVNMISQASFSLIEDGRSESNLRQGVTLELIGEGQTMGPLNAAMTERMRRSLGKDGPDVSWTTLGGAMEFIERRGVATNIASFVGATSVRVYVLKYEDRRATPAELVQMQDLVTQAMKEGALGLTSALEYAPAAYADTAELIELAKAAGRYGGIYISHMRNEGDTLLESVDELITIAREARVPAHIYHLKAIGPANWPKMQTLIAKVAQARASGLNITADIYPYIASFTGFDVTMPLWVQEGGNDAWIARLEDPQIRKRVIAEMRDPGPGRSRLVGAGLADKVLVLDTTRNKELATQVAGKTLSAIARERGTSVEDTIIDLVIADRSRLRVAYFLMSEDNLRLEMRQPWVSFGSDGASYAAEGEILDSKVHPRDYGTFARVLGHYVRDEKVVPLPEAIRRLSGLPAATLGLRERGTIAPGNFADLVVFDASTVADRATFLDPHRYATGVRDVFVNGVQVISAGEHTGARPGRFVRGPAFGK